jgi:spermidine synthase
MAMQIVWFRYLCMLFGGYRPVFSILLTTILVGIWLGALAGGWLARRQRHAELAYALALAGFAAVAFLALVLGGPGFEARHLAYADAEHAPWPFYAVIAKGTAWRALLPALLSGASFPLANAVVQRTSESVGERAGFLYLGNTLGGVLGSLLGGFVLLPRFGMQGTAAFVAAAGLLAVVAVALGSRPLERPRGLVLGGAFAAALATLAAWLTLPANELLFRALPPELVSRDSHILALHEGRNETIAVVEAEGPSLTLVTNGHYMSTTDFSSQRYMRAFVHVPLLLADGVERVMVMCYGVGNTVDAALLHRGVRSVDVVDLSRDVLEHARYFASANGDPLADPRVHVYVNDARHHLRMQAGETYDLITGEPPPIAYAGVVNLYSREFFELAESRLRPHGMLTYWLPLNQVGEQVARSIVRAFLDVFPGAVLLSGHGHQLILVGRKGGTLALDPERVRQALARDPELRRELRWLSLDRPAEWAGLLAGTPETLRRATRAVEPLRDDRPSLEYGTRSMRRDRRVPRDLFSLADLETWCPSCRSGALSSDERSELEGYVALMATYHRSAAFLEHQPGQTRAFEIERTPDVERAIAASVYLQLWLRRLPPAYYNALHLARHGLRNEAVAGLKAMLAHDPGDARARLELADLYLALGEAEQSRAELERLLRDHPDDARALALLASLDGATRSPVR